MNKPQRNALEAHLLQNVGRLFTYVNAPDALSMIATLHMSDDGAFYYAYYSLDTGKLYNAPCHMFSAEHDVKWLTPVKNIDPSDK